MIDATSIKQQTWFTRSVGWIWRRPEPCRDGARRGSAMTSAPTRENWNTQESITPRLINELSIGVFYNTEFGPPEDDLALASIQKAYDRAAALGDCAPHRSAKGSRLMPKGVGRQIPDVWQVLGVSTFATGQVSNVTFATTDNFRLFRRG